jgi:uncharacterized protein with NAD-binding domain and iron-sulfur cluster
MYLIDKEAIVKMVNEETLIEKVYDLLKRNAENVSVNHWVNAIHEDKFERLAGEIVELFTKPAVKDSACDHYYPATQTGYLSCEFCNETHPATQ